MRAYRWGEDGLLGICDRQCRLCFSVSLWNEKDPILKERIFGLTGPEGNHGEDVKECYYYLDSTPTHSYMKALYKYPHAQFPYGRLVEENGKRDVTQPEYELEDTEVFDQGRYWDVFAEYAKGGPEDILVKITVANRGPEAARVHLLPTLWYRNTWIWGCKHEGCTRKPIMKEVGEGHARGTHETLGVSHFFVGPGPDGKVPPLLWTENETNSTALFGIDQYTPYTKDAFHRSVCALSISQHTNNTTTHTTHTLLTHDTHSLLTHTRTQLSDTERGGSCQPDPEGNQGLPPLPAGCPSRGTEERVHEDHRRRQQTSGQSIRRRVQRGVPGKTGGGR